MGATTEFALPWPELGSSADGPAAMQALSVATEAAIKSVRDTAGWSTYTPTWSSDGTVQPSGITWTGRYMIRAGKCTVLLFGQIPSGVSGGTGNLYLTLPQAASATFPVQNIPAKLYQGNAGADWTGHAILTGGSNVMRPYFPYGGATANHGPWRSSDNTAAAGTGVPQIGGQYSVQLGNIWIGGDYMV